MLVDTHCHVNFKVFRDSYAHVIERALERDIGIIIVGAAKATSERAVAIAHEYRQEAVYAVVGQHPSHVTDESFDQDWLMALGNDVKVVGIGETGIDLYRSEEVASHQLQKEFLQGHVEVAQNMDKPLIIHSRGTNQTLQIAIDDILNAMGQGGGMGTTNNSPQPPASAGQASLASKRGGAVFHCFTGTAEQAKQILEAGCMISFTGVITFAKELEAVVKFVPLDRLMIETDAPYLAPVPYRGKQNEPWYVEEVARKVAEIHGVEYDVVAQQTTHNATSFFHLS